MTSFFPELRLGEKLGREGLPASRPHSRISHRPTPPPQPPPPKDLGGEGAPRRVESRQPRDSRGGGARRRTGRLAAAREPAGTGAGGRGGGTGGRARARTGAAGFAGTSAPAGRLSRPSRAPEFLGQLVRAVPGRAAGAGQDAGQVRRKRTYRAGNRDGRVRAGSCLSRPSSGAFPDPAGSDGAAKHLAALGR